LHLLVDFLGERGFTVLAALNGQEALNVLRETSDLPSVIFLDLMMPVMDGSTFRNEQLKDPRLSYIPIVVMTADAQVKSRTQEIGGVGYLRKPMDIDQILDTLARFCTPVLHAN
jgi:two-component system response regulator MprA